MRRLISVILILCLSLCLFAGCGAQEETPAQTTTTPPTTQETLPTLTGPEALDGKKILFIGNSYSFCGFTVLGLDNTILLQEKRENDQGIFYQLCKAKGIDVSVTNWAYGSHSLTDFFQGSCNAGRECQGVDHEMHITDPYFDYIIIQPHVERGYSGDFAAYLDYILNFFREANPNVQFLLHIPHMAHDRNNLWVQDLDQLAEIGIKVCDWGGLVYDVIEGTAEVPGATQEYDFHTFVINWREDDGFHQNMLCGYLTALMVYCAITGESAVGQPWEFTNDPSLHPKMDWQKAKDVHYSYDPTTNFIEVFQSEADMHGLQQLADEYLAKYNEVN